MKKVRTRKVLKGWAQNLLVGVFAINCVLLVCIDDFEICPEFFLTIGGMILTNVMIYKTLMKHGKF